jgi:site-specific DNA-methyltransferase (adenine-specific)
MIQLFNDDCLKVLPTIPDKSIDLILTDPPYGTTLVNGIVYSF